MKIIELVAENIKRLKVVTIKPTGNIVQITGKNGQGKTSVLDAIWWALEGQKNIQAVPIRKGATTAKIKLDLGELKVTRTFSASKDPKTKEPTGQYTTSIIVEDEKGARFQSPQGVIDSLLGALSFDPLAFTRMKPAEQMETLKRFVPGVDFESIDRENKSDFDKRTELNRRAKELKARASGIVIDENAPTVEIEEAALVVGLDEAGKFNSDIETRKLRREGAANEILRSKSAFEENQIRIQKLREEESALVKVGKSLLASIEDKEKKLSEAEPLPEPIDTAAIQESIRSARVHNKAFSARVTALSTREKLDSEAESTEFQAAALTEQMEIRKKKKAEAISAAKMPIEGIGFGDGVVLMAGVPFDQASDAERLRASVGIAASMNPKLRVIRVRDGSLLDSDAMTLLSEFADQNDMQIWIERVDSSGKVGFVLEDGELAEGGNL